MSRTLALVPYALDAARNFIANQNYPAARRQLRRLLRVEARSSEACYLLGLAWENDPYGSDEKAYKCYRRAVRLDTHHAMALAALGRNALRLNKDALGMTALKKALRTDPTDVNVIGIVIDTYLEVKDLDSAWKVACQARFVLPASRVVEALWNRVRFARTAKQSMPQMPVKLNRGNVLPFLRIAGEASRFPRLRRDGVSFNTPHIG